MAKILVSILSDNPVANFIFYKEKREDFDSQIFITTPKMTEKGVGECLETAMGLELGSVRRIEVPDDSLPDAVRKLKSENLSQDDTYWINQTGGTKVMSIAVFVFFQGYDAHFVYLPIGGKAFLNMLQKNVSYPITCCASLQEYLALYGIRYESNANKLHSQQQVLDIFEQIKKKRWHVPYDLKKAENYYETPEDKVFYKGAWFEEFSYWLIKQKYGLGDDYIAMSAKLYRNDSKVNDNEIDVIYVRENILNIVECKVTMIGVGDKKDTVNGYLYKLAAIVKDMGLKVNASVYTLHRMNSFSEGERAGFEKRRKILGLDGIFDGPKLDAMLDEIKQPKLVGATPITDKSRHPIPTSRATARPTDTSRAFELPEMKIKVVDKIDLAKIPKR